MQKLQKEVVKSFLDLCRVHKVLLQDITTNLSPETSQEQQEELQGKRELKLTATMATTKTTSQGRSLPGPFYAHTEEQEEELQGKRELKLTTTMATTKVTSQGRSLAVCVSQSQDDCQNV